MADEVRKTQAGLGVRASILVAAQVKHSLSRQHLKAAKYFATESAAIEKACQAGPEEQDFVRHRAYVTGTVISAAAFLEASINELYLEARDKDKNSLAGLDDRILSLLAVFWEQVERGPILRGNSVRLA